MKMASHEEVSLNKLLASRVKDPEALKILTDTYTGKNSLNLKKVKLRVEVYSLKTNVLLRDVARPRLRKQQMS